MSIFQWIKNKMNSNMENDRLKDLKVKCPNCETGMIVERISKRGRSKGQKFYACDQYPTCKSTYTSLDEIPVVK